MGRNFNKRFQYYFCELDKLVFNSDEIGHIIGYAVIAGLLNVHTASSSNEEIQLLEIKSIYSQLECSIDICKQEGSFEAICYLTQQVQQYLGDNEPDISASNSRLLEDIMSDITIRKGNNADIVRRRGLRLYKDIIRQPSTNDNRFSSITRDYNTIARNFV